MQLKRILKIQIESSVNGLHGLERYTKDIKKTCCQKYFHFILMDLEMPIMNGLKASKKIHQVYEKLKATAEYQHIKEPKIFAVTAHAD